MVRLATRDLFIDWQRLRRSLWYMYIDYRTRVGAISWQHIAHLLTWSSRYSRCAPLFARPCARLDLKFYAIVDRVALRRPTLLPPSHKRSRYQASARACPNHKSASADLLVPERSLCLAHCSWFCCMPKWAYPQSRRSIGGTECIDARRCRGLVHKQR